MTRAGPRIYFVFTLMLIFLTIGINTSGAAYDLCNDVKGKWKGSHKYYSYACQTECTINKDVEWIIKKGDREGEIIVIRKEFDKAKCDEEPRCKVTGVDRLSWRCECSENFIECTGNVDQAMNRNETMTHLLLSGPIESVNGKLKIAFSGEFENGEDKESEDLLTRDKITGFKLLNTERICDAPQTKLGETNNVETCAQLCQEKVDCKYFIHGNGKAGVEIGCYEQSPPTGCHKYKDSELNLYMLELTLKKRNRNYRGRENDVHLPGGDDDLEMCRLEASIAGRLVKRKATELSTRKKQKGLGDQEEQFECIFEDTANDDCPDGFVEEEGTNFYVIN